MLWLKEALDFLVSSGNIEGLTDTKWTPTGTTILAITLTGILINLGAAILLHTKHKTRLFARLLKSLVISDLLVLFSCCMLWGIPRGHNQFTDQVFPFMAPYLVGKDLL